MMVGALILVEGEDAWRLPSREALLAAVLISLGIALWLIVSTAAGRKVHAPLEAAGVPGDLSNAVNDNEVVGRLPRRSFMRHCVVVAAGGVGIGLLLPVTRLASALTINPPIVPIPGRSTEALKNCYTMTCFQREATGVAETSQRFRTGQITVEEMRRSMAIWQAESEKCQIVCYANHREV